MTYSPQKISLINAYRRKTKYATKNFLDNYPSIYTKVHKKFSSNKGLFFNYDTDLVIDGFPSSGNTFLYRSFCKRVKNPLNISHHMHSTSQIRIATLGNVPVLLCFRDPIDTAVSNSSRQQLSYGRKIISEEKWLKYWYQYHLRLLDLIKCQNIYLCPFSKIINQTALIINDTVATFFPSLDCIEGDFDSEIFSEISLHEQQIKKGKFANAALPSKEKTIMKKNIKESLTNKHPVLVEKAMKLYKLINKEYYENCSLFCRKC